MSEPLDSRDKILLEAQRLFVAHGYRGLSMRQLAAAVGISKAGIYHYFRDKEDLFLAILRKYIDELNELITATQATDQSCRERITRIVDEILSQPADHRAVLRLASQEMAHLSTEARQSFTHVYHQQFIDQITRILQEGMASGELRPLDANTATWALLGMMYPYVFPSNIRGMAPSPERVAQLLTIYFDGLCA